MKLIGGNSMLGKIIKKINNGILIIILGLLHTNFSLSNDGFGSIIKKFSESYFFHISSGLNELPATVGVTNFETMAAFWFFYFGLMLIILGILLYYIEKEMKRIPHPFTISYILVVLVGCYMIPNSGMTYLMLPHAIFMLGINFYKSNLSTENSKVVNENAIK